MNTVCKGLAYLLYHANIIISFQKYIKYQHAFLYFSGTIIHFRTQFPNLFGYTICTPCCICKLTFIFIYLFSLVWFLEVFRNNRPEKKKGSSETQLLLVSKGVKGPALLTQCKLRGTICASSSYFRSIIRTVLLRLKFCHCMCKLAI